MLAITDRQARHGSAVAAVFGTLGGIWLGSALALALVNTRCQPDCGAVELGAWDAFMGVPIAAGYGAWRASGRLTEEVIYRRPVMKEP